jgi:hypothetical protein
LVLAPLGDFMRAQLGVVALTLLLTHNDAPPASIRLLLFGSRMKGAMKFALEVPLQP